MCDKLSTVAGMLQTLIRGGFSFAAKKRRPLGWSYMIGPYCSLHLPGAFRAGWLRTSHTTAVRGGCDADQSDRYSGPTLP